jgi:RNA polymerase sigma-70 factor (sigma-E family)
VREPDGFRDFVAARSSALLRTAWLLTGDWFLAQDLVQDALTRTWARWDRVRRQDAPDAYVRKVMLSTYLSWRRRRWNGEVAAASPPERPAPSDDFAAADLRQTLQAALSGLAARQRAVVVLRCFDDLTETQAADALGCTVGTVKSQSAKALARLRADPHLAAILTEETTR